MERRQRLHDALCVPGERVDHQVDGVAGARHALQARNKRAREHVRDTGARENSHDAR